jgi:hypothetical protein
VVAYVRTVKTASGAVAVQIVWSSRRGSRRIEHLGSAHDDAVLEVLKAAAAQRLAEGQQVLDLGLDDTGGGQPLEITSSRAGHLWDALCRVYETLGFDRVLDGSCGAIELVRTVVAPTKLSDPRNEDSNPAKHESCPIREIIRENLRVAMSLAD